MKINMERLTKIGYNAVRSGEKLRKKYSLIQLIIFLCIISGIIVSANSCRSNQASQPLPVTQFTAAHAETAARDFVSVFWDPARKYFYCNSDRQINPDHAAGPDNGLYTDYWWEAQLCETIMDIYERTGSVEYRQMIEDVFTGFLTEYPDWSSNVFNDDIGWWSLAAIRAYNLLGEQKYLALAKEMFDFIYTQWDDTMGGGLWWNRISYQPQKNVATNGAAAVIALRLFKALGDEAYLEKANALYDWVRGHLYDPRSGRVYDHIRGGANTNPIAWEFTYNFGLFGGASFELFQHYGDPQYLEDAFKAFDWVLKNKTRDNGTTLEFEGTGDAAGFKMVYSRFLRDIANSHPVPEYQRFLQTNATQAWNNRRRSDGVIGPDWRTIPADNPIQSLAAAAGVSILHLAEP